MFFAVLLLAASATPAVGPEIASTPIPVFIGPPPTAPAAPLVVDGNGFLLAFTMSSGVRTRSIVTRLDAQAQAVAGATRELPMTDANNDAVMPSVAVAPNGYFAVQTEIAPRGVFLAVWHLDRSLSPDPAPFAIVSKSVSGAAPAPGFVRIDGNRVFVIADDLTCEYDLGGALLRITRAPFAAGDALFAGGALVTAGAETAPSTVQCAPFIRCFPVPPHFDALVGFDATDSIRLSFPFNSPNGIAAASDGSTLLYVLVGPTSMAFLRYDVLGRWPIDLAPQPLGASFTNDSPQRPSIAFDGTRFVAVWRMPVNGRHGIGAAVIDRDGTVTPIAIPNLGDETLPFVLSAGPNRFLVSYLSRRDGEYRVAGRFIYFELGRRPVVRR